MMRQDNADGMMKGHKQRTPVPRPKLLDSIYLLLAGLAVVAGIGAAIAFFIAYDTARWMPHGDHGKQLFGVVFGLGFGVAYLYQTWQSRRLQRALAGKPHLQPLATLVTNWWVSLAISLTLRNCDLLIRALRWHRSSGAYGYCSCTRSTIRGKCAGHVRGDDDNAHLQSAS